MAERWEETKIKTKPETSDYVRNLALGIQSELDRQGLSVNRLAKRSETPVSTITGLLDRAVAPDLMTVEQICRALEIDPATLFLRGRAIWLEQRMRTPAYRPSIFIMPFPGE